MLEQYIRPVLRQYLVVIIVNLNVLCVGLGLAWPSPVLVKLRNETETVLSRPITEEEGSWIVSIGFLCGTISNFLAGYLVDHIGRKYCVILTCIPRLIACFLLTFATDIWMLLLGRALLGLADTFTFVVVPMYASEVASKDVRGALGTFLQIFSSIGIVTMLCMGPFLPYFTLNVIFTSVVAVTAVPLLFLPDSPYFLYSKGRREETLKVLTYLRGSEDLAKDEIKEYSLMNGGQKIDKKDLIKNKIFLKALSIVIILAVGSQLIGFNAVTFYLQTVLESTNTSVRPEIASVVIGLIQLTASFCTTLVTDRFGRKPILTTTLVGMALGMIGLGAFFKLKENDYPIEGFLNFVPLISLILVVYCFSAGVGSLNWLLSAELFDGHSRAIGSSISGLISIIFLFLTTKYFALVTLAIGPTITYWIFSVNCVLLCLFIMFCVPETKGKSFAEIQESLGGKRVTVDDISKDKNDYGSTKC